ncbi:NERD domain-containing protein [Frankia sp. AiPs1]|uniref:nuclease-related domain-containing protein n=1 Tax=Frankia sp. AiPs1 TaxID=573493 RepID=UPI00204372A2|nr:NERD domain-containing protein [Frankia sp. AiPs1]MCM3924092.1 NERD domain-containing protein [Frankia sp. AiPs1]
MVELQVRPWKRFGQDRLYVNLHDGRSAACFDRRTSELTLLLDVDRDAVLAALAAHLPDPPTPVIRTNPPAATSTTPAPNTRTPTATAHTAHNPVAGREVPAQPSVGPAELATYSDDLAGNPPGLALQAKLAELTPGFWRALIDRLLRRPRPETESWRKGLAGEQLVAAELDALTARGWRVLHSIPLPRNMDIDHLLIGPGGVFTLNTKNHRGARIWVGDRAATINGQAYRYVDRSRAEAKRASAALSDTCGFPIAVAGVLVFVEADTLTVTPSLTDVYATHHDLIAAAFEGVTGVWQPADVETIYACARRRRTWHDA